MKCSFFPIICSNSNWIKNFGLLKSEPLLLQKFYPSACALIIILVAIKSLIFITTDMRSGDPGKASNQLSNTLIWFQVFFNEVSINWFECSADIVLHRFQKNEFPFQSNPIEQMKTRTFSVNYLVEQFWEHFLISCDSQRMLTSWFRLIHELRIKD